MNKKGEIGFILGFFVITAVILVAGFILLMVSALVNLGADEIIPEIQDLGMIDNINISKYSVAATQPVYSVIQSLNWISGMIYIIGLVGLFGVSLSFRITGQKWLIPIFLLWSLLLIMASIFVSQMYEDIISDNDDFSNYVKDNTLLAFIVLNSPVIFTTIIFISGIIMFSGVGEDNLT